MLLLLLTSNAFAGGSGDVSDQPKNITIIECTQSDSSPAPNAISKLSFSNACNSNGLCAGSATIRLQREGNYGHAVKAGHQATGSDSFNVQSIVKKGYSGYEYGTLFLFSLVRNSYDWKATGTLDNLSFDQNFTCVDAQTGERL